MHPTLAAAGLGALMVLSAPARADGTSCWVYFGTSATGADRGIYCSRLDQETGSLSPAERVGDKRNSVFMAFSPDKTRLYSLAEYPAYGWNAVEAIETYAVDPATGRLGHLGERIAGGPEACHISVDPSGRCVLTANYDGHYVEAFPIGVDTMVGERMSMRLHSGSGPNVLRQESAHPHSINVDPSGRFAIVPDLGLDRLFVYRLDAARAVLAPNDPPFVRLTPGSGPRHFAFHQDGRHAFVINELNGTITALNWDASTGALSPYATVPILPRDYRGTNTSAEVVVGKSGKFVYGSNRGDDSIVVLAFDPATGRLTYVQRMVSGIKTPRNYAIDPSGRWLLCGNLTANTVTVYRVEPGSGRLSLSGTIAVPQPLCVRFLQI